MAIEIWKFKYQRPEKKENIMLLELRGLKLKTFQVNLLNVICLIQMRLSC